MRHHWWLIESLKRSGGWHEGSAAGRRIRYNTVSSSVGSTGVNVCGAGFSQEL